MHDGVIELFEIVKTSSSPIIVCGAICSDKNIFSYGLMSNKGNPILPNNLRQKGMYMNGNCVLVPRDIYNQVGNLDSIFPHAIGDYDYGLRAIKNGFEILTTKRYVGRCNQNELLPVWCYSKTSFKKRIEKLYSPLGNAHPYYFFIYERRHFGILVAVKHFLSIYLRCCTSFSMENLASYIFQIDSKIVNDTYMKSENIKVVDVLDEASNLCVVYFSSNELYYPNTEYVFQNTIEKRDKYEWINTKYPGAKRHIFVSDIQKYW